MSHAEVVCGDLLLFDGNPTRNPWQETVRIATDGALLIEDGVIKSIGAPRDFPDLPRHDHRGRVICPGFGDAHAHYPQTAIIASWGKRLIDWLNTYTFPEEMQFGDPKYAAEIAALYLDLLLAHGTTSVASYCTTHPESVTAFFEAAAERKMAVIGGKTCMDRNAPNGLCDPAQSAYDDSKRLLDRWHGRDRARYAITPRFSPTSTPEQLRALGDLWAEYPDCLMQTHLSEQLDEVSWVRGLFREARDYLDTYEAFGLLGSRGVYGHAIHLERREIDRLEEVGAGLVHCPTSNTFIGPGLFDMRLSRRIKVGLATDTGGGSSFSMLRTMASAYEIGQLCGNALHPAELLWMATAGSAGVLHRGDEIGTIAVGMAADLCILDLHSTPGIAQRAARANDVWDAVFPTIMMGDERAVAEVWVAGSKVRAG